MKLLSIASGSSGNCIYVGNEDTHILIDAGISGKRIEEGLNTIGLTTRDMDAVFVTHEHIDHIGGLGVIARKYGLPIYGTQGTLDEIRRTKSVGKIEEDLYRSFHKKDRIQVKEFLIEPVSVSHDAADPVAYRVTDGKKKIGVVTDLGYYDEGIVEHLQGMDAILLEANHDVHMLQTGSYPYPLKQRILGNSGHLSNENAGRLLCRLLHDNLSDILLGHLSNENNLPELAFEAVRLEIIMGDTTYDPEDFKIQVARRSQPTQVVEI